MNRSAELRGLSDPEWERVRRFEAAWQEAASPQEAPDLVQFLPAADDQRRKAILLEVIKADLECRWRRHSPIFVEHYLTRFPELGPRRDLSADLLYEELRIRRAHGDAASIQEYEARFPEQFASLQRLLQARPLPTIPSAAPSATPPGNVGSTFVRAGSGEILQVGHGYRLLNRLGSGSFGEVWKAEAPGGVAVAVKIIFRPLDHAASQAELRSLEIIKQLRHPYLLSTQAFWSLEDRLVIVMELADGSLRGRLKECLQAGEPGIPPLELVAYFRDAAEALDYLHSERVYHRDVKPDNILLLQRHAKVADFGLARLQEASRLFSATGSGTPAYMAPEVWQSKISLHSDQYSLALSYAELRLTRRPFRGVALADLMMDHLQGLPDLEPLPRGEQTAILRGLAKKPEERFSNCQEFMQAVERAVRVELYPAPPPPPPPLTVVDEAELDEEARAEASIYPLPEGTAPLATTVSFRAEASGQSTLDRWKHRTAPRRPPIGWGIAAALLLAAALVCGLLALWNHDGGSGSFTLEAPPRLVLGTGEKKTLLLPLHRDNYRGPVDLNVLAAPPGVSIQARPVGDLDREVQLEIIGDPGASRSHTPIILEASGGGHRERAVFTLILLPLPPFCIADGEDIQKDERGDYFYRHIASVLPNGERVPFVLVWKQKPEDPASFYIMRDKVSVGQFRYFVQTRGLRYWPGLFEWLLQFREGQDRKGTPWWNPGVGDQFPALGAYVEDAHAFAENLHGLLPTTRQWDTASGRYEVPRGEGPYAGTLNELRATLAADYVGAGFGLLGTASLRAALAASGGLIPAIAFDRGDPLAVGEAYADRGPFGCRDMAGNGWEWVRNLVSSDAVVPLRRLPSSEDNLELRGRTFDYPYPLRFKDLDDERKNDGCYKPYTGTGFDVGFRVVLEP